MFKEYDIVVAKKQIENVPSGTIGTILIIYEDKKVYEVEFVDNEGGTINVLTVNENNIEFYK